MIFTAFPQRRCPASAGDGGVVDSPESRWAQIAAAYRGRAADNLLLVISLALGVDSSVLARHDVFDCRRREHSLFSAWRLQRCDQLDHVASCWRWGSAGYYSRVLHTSLCEAFDQDYVRTARGKGLSRTRVMLRHAMANALLPLVTLAGLDLAGLLSGVVLTETVFNWPGIGRLAADAIFNLDIPVIMGTVWFSAFLIVVVNLLVDLLYAWLDPRIRLAETG